MLKEPIWYILAIIPINSSGYGAYVLADKAPKTVSNEYDGTVVLMRSVIRLLRGLQMKFSQYRRSPDKLPQRLANF
jgi:hypothetical protein